MPFIGDRDAVDDMMRIAFGNRADRVTRDRTTAHIPNAGDGNAVDRKMMGTYAHDLATVRRRVAKTNYVGHHSAFIVARRRVIGCSLCDFLRAGHLIRTSGRRIVVDQFPHRRRPIRRARALELLP